MLSEAAGYSVSHTTVVLYERGATVPTEYVAAVSRAFRVNPAWLVMGEGIPEAVDPPLAQYVIERIARLLDETRPALGLAQTRLEFFFRAVPVLFAIMSSELRFEKLNPAWGREFGYSYDELLGAPLVDFVHPLDRSATVGALRGLVEGAAVRGLVSRLRRRDGTYRRMVWNGACAGGLVHTVAVEVPGRK